MITLNAGCGTDMWGDVRIDIRLINKYPPIGEPTSVNIIGDVEFLPFRSKIFNCIKLQQVLEHMKSPFRVLTELKRVLSGALFISVPNVYHFKNFVKLIWKGFKYPTDYRTYHLQGWSPNLIKRLAYFTGFKVVDFRWNFLRQNLYVCLMERF